MANTKVPMHRETEFTVRIRVDNTDYAVVQDIRNLLEVVIAQFNEKPHDGVKLGMFCSKNMVYKS